MAQRPRDPSKSRPAQGRGTRRRAREPEPIAPDAAELTPTPAGMAALVRTIGAALASGVSGRMAASGGVGLRVGKALLLSPEAAGMRREAGRYVRELREVAGLTLDDLAEALQLSDRSLLAAVEKGTATLSFELILRLSALLARNDPVPFVAKLTRSYNPTLWKLLESWGIGRIPLQFERERRFLNIYRAQDAARQLSDQSFDRVLEFTQAAFRMALELAAAEGHAPRARRARPKRPRRS